MSMRKGLRVFRPPRTNPDEYAAHIQQQGQVIRHQPRGTADKCTECWDDVAGDYSPACSTCGGSGYILKSLRKIAYVSFTQPFGNFGSTGQIFKAGGQHTRYSAYVYMALKAGKEVGDGDRFVIEQSGVREEFVVMNRLPQRAGVVTVGWLFECGSASDKSLEEITV